MIPVAVPLLVAAVGAWWFLTPHAPRTAPGVAQRIATAYGIPLPVAQAVADVATEHGMSPSHLAAVIHFESGRTWSASARHPSGEAVGLIQFRARSAARLGTTLDALARQAPEAQIRTYVSDYFRAVRRGEWPDDPVEGPLDTLQSVAMAVFYPAYRFVPEHTAFPSVVQRANPGIVSPADYLRKVRNLARESV